MSIHILDASFVASATDLSQLPAPQRAEIAFAGRSNVGKSSLINRLCDRKKLVRTSSRPGCTRGINIFKLRLRDQPPHQKVSSAQHTQTGQVASEFQEKHLDLVDLPGYGFARRSKSERMSWGPLMESFLSTRPGLRGVVVIVDVRRGLEPDDFELIEFLDHVGQTPIIAATKLDKLPKSKMKLALKNVQQGSRLRVYGFSAETGEGRDRLWRAILKTAALDLPSENETSETNETGTSDSTEHDSAGNSTEHDSIESGESS